MPPMRLVSLVVSQMLSNLMRVTRLFLVTAPCPGISNSSDDNDMKCTTISSGISDVSYEQMIKTEKKTRLFCEQ